jgi:hypothetical protein
LDSCPEDRHHRIHKPNMGRPLAQAWPPHTRAS